jgi:NAD(P)H-dependent FMN reductase
MPMYGVDLQAVGFPADIITFADTIRKADGMRIMSPKCRNGLLDHRSDSLARSSAPG